MKPQSTTSRPDGALIAVAAVALAVGVGVAVAMDQLLAVVAVAVLAAFVAGGTVFRLSVLLAMLAGNAAYWLGLPTGSYVVLIAIAVLLDVVRTRRAEVSPGTAWWWLVCCVLTLALNQSRFGVALVGGLTLFVYLQVTTRERIPAAAMVAVAVAGAANALWSVTHPGLNYIRFSEGAPVEVTRGVGAGLDPNASAVLLLLGSGASCWGLLRLRGLARALCGAAALACTAGVASTGSRGAAVGIGLIAVGTSIAAIRRRGGVTPVLAAFVLTVAALLPYVAYRVILTNNALYRFYLVNEATQRRKEIYSAWLDAWLRDLPSFFFGVSGSDFRGAVPETPPHNSLLELAAHVGVVGCLAIVMLVLSARTARPSPGVELTSTALALLLVGMLIGLSAGYTPWIALALLARRRQVPVAAEPPSRAARSRHRSLVPHAVTSGSG